MDGYQNVALDKIMYIIFSHLCSGVDEETTLDNKSLGASKTDITGFTEWVDEPNRRLSIGWDWKMTLCNSKVHYKRINSPRSNIMLVDHNLNNLSHNSNTIHLCKVIDKIPWTSKIESYLNN